MLNDLRYAVRLLRKNPAFTVVAVLTLVLGIGANTAIFSVVKEVLLRPLPFRDSDRLVMVWEDASHIGFPRNTPAPANYADWKAQNRVFEDMAAVSWQDVALVGDGEAERLSALAVTASFFTLLGVAPELGRTFLPDDDRPGARKVVVLSHGVWQRRYGGERRLIGRDLLLNGEKHTVIGVMPRGFQFLEPYIAMWIPAALGPEDLANRGAHYLTVFARLKPGIQVSQAQADIQTIMSRIARDHPDQAGKLGAVVVPLRDQFTSEARRPLLLLLAAVGCVLLIACANLANLLLSRASGRQKEMTLRAALGADRPRLVRQSLIESLLLAGLGGLGGLLFAQWSLTLLEGLVPPAISLMTRLQIDTTVLAFTAVLTVVAGVLFGLAPALRSSRLDLRDTLAQGGRAGLGGPDSGLRAVLVSTEVALASMLLVGAGLLVQTMLRLTQQYDVLRPDRVLTLRTVLPSHKYDSPADRHAFYTRVLERVTALPGVINAGYATAVPLDWKGGTNRFTVEGQPQDENLGYDAVHRQVSAGYLQAVGTPLTRGRYFTGGDSEKSLPVAIINETMARQYWAGGSALGKRFKIGGPTSDTPWITVVGIVADIRQMGADAPVKAEMYFPYAQVNDQPWFAPRALAIRSTVDPMRLAELVRQEVRGVDPDQPVSNIRTMSEVVGEETGSRRLATTLLTAFAVVGVLLASLGVYGVLSYFVGQHTREIGVRVALGAQTRDILRLVLGRSAALVGIGLVAGLVGAYALTRSIQGLLFGVSATDPMTFAGVPLLLTLVALVASYLPARRAARVDPLVALRAE